MDYVKKGSSTLGVTLGCKRKYASRKVNPIALDGTPYTQTTGNATHYRTVHIYCETYEKRDAMDNASNGGALLDVEFGGVTYRGTVEKDVTWREWRDGHGVGSFTLIVREVIE
jgi:hypothetical protein